MCNCSDLEAPAVFKNVVRRARKRHRCAECRGLIEPGQHYWQARVLWDGQWNSYCTCGACSVIGHTLLGCYIFCGLAECIDEELGLDDRFRGSEARIAYAGMRRRRRRAEQTLRQEALNEVI